MKQLYVIQIIVKHKIYMYDISLLSWSPGTNYNQKTSYLS